MKTALDLAFSAQQQVMLNIFLETSNSFPRSRPFERIENNFRANRKVVMKGQTYACNPDWGGDFKTTLSVCRLFLFCPFPIFSHFQFF